MDDSTEQMILDELHGLRDDFQAFARECGERISVLETHVKSGITGNGQPSRLQMLEKSLVHLQRWRWWLIGAAACCGGVVSILVVVLGWRFR